MTTNRQTAVIEGDQHVRTNQQTPRVLIAAIAVAALALVVRAAPPVEAAGLTNCVDLIGRAGACYETVWANGVQLRMTFPKEAQQFTGATSSDRLGNFYVLAPQTDTPGRAALPARPRRRQRASPERWHLRRPPARLPRPVQCGGHRQRRLRACHDPTLPRQDSQRAAADLGRRHRVGRKRRAAHAGRHRGRVRRHHQPRQVEKASLPTYRLRETAGNPATNRAIIAPSRAR